MQELLQLLLGRPDLSPVLGSVQPGWGQCSEGSQPGDSDFSSQPFPEQTGIQNPTWSLSLGRKMSSLEVWTSQLRGGHGRKWGLAGGCWSRGEFTSCGVSDVLNTGTGGEWLVLQWDWEVMGQGKPSRLLGELSQSWGVTFISFPL